MSLAATKNAHIWPRAEDEWYVEPIAVTAALLRVERFVGSIIDPACGGGNIIQACRAAGYEDAWGYDLVARVPHDTSWFGGISDFVVDDPSFSVVNVICNPPFFRAKGTEAFARRSLALATGKVAIFADLRFLASARRADGLFSDHPPTRIWMIADRPSCPPGTYLAAGNVARGGTADWCWIIWDQTAPGGETRFGWLRKVVS